MKQPILSGKARAMRYESVPANAEEPIFISTLLKTGFRAVLPAGTNPQTILKTGPFGQNGRPDRHFWPIQNWRLNQAANFCKN
jgi:hypothetical protein